MSLIATAPASSAARATSAEKVSAEIGSSVRAARPSIAGTSRAASSSAGTGGPLRAATAPTSSISKPASASASAVLDRLLGRPAPRPLEHRVVGDVDDPDAERALEVERPVAELPAARATGSNGRPRYGWRALALRCVYTDLDGTLLGRYGSLFRDSEGEFSMLQARALEACHRAGVEVVIKSGPPRGLGAGGRQADRLELLHLRGRLRWW